ncbi:hypothetical protein Ddye_018735 [Dipteronia dyeriana]|uniref:Uncharacterized protein n=1 Tax=Dipteronia dyeriana TaxID=168575 RepID=A0AAD9UBL8_9ROSI|nr:hypothetical protein Ddye_018735 [Dipteronia dyeriana]
MVVWGLSGKALLVLVASLSPGMDVIRAGGHVVDAFVVAAICLGVVGPTSSGIGRGAFILVRLASGRA